MRGRTILLTAMGLAIAGGVAIAGALTEEELIAKIKAAGYTDVSDIKSTAEGTTARATRNGKQVRIVVDSAGQIKQAD